MSKRIYTAETEPEYIEAGREKHPWRQCNVGDRWFYFFSEMTEKGRQNGGQRPEPPEGHKDLWDITKVKECYNEDTGEYESAFKCVKIADNM